AAPAYAGIPVTHRDYASSFAIVTGHSRAEKDEDQLNWPALAQGIDTIAFYMGIGNLPYIVSRLIENGKSPDTKAAIIQWGTTAKQKTVTGSLKDIEVRALEAGITHPAIVLVGDVVGLREKLRWFQEAEEKQEVGIGRD
ncbi:MAG: uroporphyrinogen-III C-methyltransferase, partial [Bacillus sp. (in: firmicutes)]